MSSSCPFSALTARQSGRRHHHCAAAACACLVRPQISTLSCPDPLLLNQGLEPLPFLLRSPLLLFSLTTFPSIRPKPPPGRMTDQHSSSARPHWHAWKPCWASETPHPIRPQLLALNPLSRLKMSFFNSVKNHVLLWSQTPLPAN